VVERLLDVLFFIILLPVTILLFLPVWPAWMRWGGVVAVGALLLFGLLAFLLRYKRATLSRFVKGQLEHWRYQKLVRPVRNFLQGIGPAPCAASDNNIRSGGYDIPQDVPHEGGIVRNKDTDLLSLAHERFSLAFRRTSANS